MLAADPAKVFLPEIQDDLAKPLLVEVRTPFIGAKPEMRLAVVGDALPYSLSVARPEALIFLEGLAVNVDLPTDAAAVLTSVGDTLKSFVIFGKEEI